MRSVDAVRCARPMLVTLALLAARGEASAQMAPPPAAGPAAPLPGGARPLEPPQPIPLEFGAFLGAGVRLGEGPSYTIVERAGVSFGASVFVTPSPPFSLGITLEHQDLGRERSDVGPAGTIEVTRDLNAIWGVVRLNLLRGPLGELGFAFGPGLAWQSADASGVLLGVPAPLPFSCSASASVNLALRAGVAGALALGGGLALTGGVTFDNVRLSSEALDGCASGAGSLSLLGVRAGLSYAFDLGPYVR